MIVTVQAIAVTRCPIANHQPHWRNQGVFIGAEPAPAVAAAMTLPKGQRANSAIRKLAIPEQDHRHDEQGTHDQPAPT